MHALIPDDLVSKLNQLQQRILAEGLPVLIIFEGSSGRVIGRVNNELIRCLEPRGVIYNHFDPADPACPRTILDFLQQTPGKGQIGLCDRSWYSQMIERSEKDGEDEALDGMLDDINDFERYLVQNGVLLIKVLLRATESAVKRYGPLYGPSVPRRSFLSMDHIDPAKYREVMFDRVYERTDTEYAPWSMVTVRAVEETVLETAETIITAIEDGLKAEPSPHLPAKIESVYPNPRKNKERGEEPSSYEDVLNQLSEELGELQMELSVSGRSMVVCFEGWDAAGKGSCIKHLCHALNPRGYEVFQTKAPTEEEAKHTYLWRFSKSVPRRGRITVYDRTWYGRMMVEHIEGFCSEEEYRRSPLEINAFERIMVSNGTILLKFWLDITPDEQLARFKKRTKDPLKKWKITEEDWRNRERWDDYDAHVDVMIGSTNTEYAPWTVVWSDNKKYSRVKVLKAVVEVLRRELGKQPL
ncbi:MAG: hypothetical protein FWG41_05055 [Methanomassiliicoccaceae archaeon]|nr:hypothetical protein [Methanomassiliicoccaceae archaeon]